MFNCVSLLLFWLSSRFARIGQFGPYFYNLGNIYRIRYSLIYFIVILLSLYYVSIPKAKNILHNII